MKNFAIFMLLLSIAVVSFVNRAFLGLPLYFAVFALMPLWIWMYWHGSTYVAEDAVRRIEKSPHVLSFMAGRVPPFGGEIERGRLTVGPSGACFYVRGKGKLPPSLAWSLPVGEIASFGIGTVLGKRKGIVFYTKSGEASFTAAKLEGRTEEFQRALGWRSLPQVPQKVEVYGEASDAPSFDEAVRNASGKPKR